MGSPIGPHRRFCPLEWGHLPGFRTPCVRLAYAQIAQAMESLRWGGPTEVRLSDAKPWSEQPLQWSVTPHVAGLRALVALPQSLRHAWQQVKHLATGGAWADLPEPEPTSMEWYETLDAQWGRGRRRAMRDQDQALVNQWRAEGWLLGEVHVHAAGPQRSFDTGCVWIGSRPQQVHDIMLNIRPGGDLPNLAKASDVPTAETEVPVFNQWLTLAHEAAHTVFVGELFPFQPSPDALRRLGVPRPEVNRQVRTWNVDLFSLGSLGPFYRQLDEAFADVYGAMMVLTSTHFHPQVIQEVQLRQRLRAAAVDTPAPSWTKETSFDEYEVTAPALQRLLDTQAEWAPLSPAEQRRHALTLISDAWLAVAAQHTQEEPGWTTRLDWSLSDHPTFHQRMLSAFCEGPGAPEAMLAQCAPLADTVGHRLWTKWLIMWRREDRETPFETDRQTWSLARLDQEGDKRREELHAFVDPWMDRWEGTKKGRTARDAWRATAQALEASVKRGYAPPSVTEPTSPERRRRRRP